MNIDWSKAPEGATHWFAPYFYKVGSSGVMFDLDDQWHKSRYSKDELFTRESCISKPALWAGAGLPPVGTVCETERNEFLRRVEILYIGVERVFVRDENGEEIALLLDGRQFFPVRTKEQIESDEREKAVQEMQDIVNSTPVAYRVGLYSLYDAGYRKQPKEDA